MKKMIVSVVATFALTLASYAYAQSTPSNDKAPPPPSGSAGSDTAGTPAPGSETGRTDTAKKSGKSKPGSSDANADKTGGSKY
jgi:hypothetical protein